MVSKSEITKDAYLVINNQIYPLNKAVTTIGRKLDNDIVIQDPLVSRYHAEIRQDGDEFFLFDLDSSCGTFVNQKNISNSQLFSGDIILLANMPVMFVDETASLFSASESITGKMTKK
jgi:pSer/pThr/pTyr-binding forkhead associated (FHA) protein